MNGKESITRETLEVIIINIPKFTTDKEAANFWDTHSFEDYVEDTKKAEIEFVHTPKKTLTVRLDPVDVEMVQKLAHYKGLSYTALIRMWIKENLRKEVKGIKNIH
ncbi:MAG: CopG family antitoxin [Candidatus Eremiobacterota bacterium]